MSRNQKSVTETDRILAAVKMALRGECGYRLAAKSLQAPEKLVRNIFLRAKRANWTEKILETMIDILVKNKEKDVPEEPAENDDVIVVEVKVEEKEPNQCRGCRNFGFKGFISLHEGDFKDLFALCTGIQVSEQDPAPQFLCQYCAKELKKFSEFRTTCIESNKYFAEKFKDVKLQQSPKVVEEIQLQPSMKSEVLEEPPNEEEKELIKLESDLESEDDWWDVPFEEEPVEKPIKPPPKKRKVKKDEEKKRPGRKRNPNARPRKKVLAIDRITCNECNKVFNRSQFLQHWRIVHLIEEEPLSCSECSKSFPNRYAHEEHQRKEHGILKCFKCSRATTYSTNPTDVKVFLSHFRKCNSDPNEKPFECPSCEMRFSSFQYLNTHQPNCIGLRVMCHVCSKMVFKRSLSMHMMIHSSVMFPCRVCGKEFNSQGARCTHEKFICTKEEVICDICGKKWPNKAKLLGHIKRAHLHLVKKPPRVQCKICGDIVSAIGSHMYSHSEKNFVCEFEGCGLSFRHYNTLRKHKHSHLKTRPMNCTMCSIGYYNREYLRGHYKRDHGLIFERGQAPYNRPTIQ